jgi:hypothetical protein
MIYEASTLLKVPDMGVGCGWMWVNKTIHDTLAETTRLLLAFRYCECVGTSRGENQGMKGLVTVSRHGKNL